MTIVKSIARLIEAAKEPTGIYASFVVHPTNAFEAWCKEHLDRYFDPTGYDYHCTVCYSESPFNAEGIQHKTQFFRRRSAKRRLAKFGDSVVLILGDDENKPFRRMWKQFMSAGASYGFPKYVAHVSLSKESRLTQEMLDKIPAYDGELHFGPMHVEPIRPKSPDDKPRKDRHRKGKRRV